MIYNYDCKIIFRKIKMCPFNINLSQNLLTYYRIFPTNIKKLHLDKRYKWSMYRKLYMTKFMKWILHTVSILKKLKLVIWQEKQ